MLFTIVITSLISAQPHYGLLMMIAAIAIKPHITSYIMYAYPHNASTEPVVLTLHTTTKYMLHDTHYGHDLVSPRQTAIYVMYLQLMMYMKSVYYHAL